MFEVGWLTVKVRDLHHEVPRYLLKHLVRGCMLTGKVFVELLPVDVEATA
ncbi:hypothetical protein BSU04_02560 [Caballeronia sordidicola]|uniref:Uncharacterized protein n=1 Tax=Caballeronia sordidicola TaxID=196367 RepID=A0A226X9G5_CABSO|nr:hypothetical protein BSU04_02560 [Caballeronia sordidicola]